LDVLEAIAAREVQENRRQNHLRIESIQPPAVREWR
jgi:hypothetical protein